MICFHDMTFCVRECGNNACERNWGHQTRANTAVYQNYLAWSAEFPDGFGPIAFSDFQECPEYITLMSVSTNAKVSTLSR